MVQGYGDEMKTKLEKYGFKDQQGHRLERCQDYLDIVDVIERAKEFIEEDSAITLIYLKKAVAKVEDYCGIEDKDSLNYLLEEAGYSEKESIKIMNIVDVFVKNKIALDHDLALITEFRKIRKLL